MTSYSTIINTDLKIPNLTINNTLSNLLVIDNSTKLVGKKDVTNLNSISNIYRFHLATSNANPGSNLVLKYGTNSTMADSTIAGSGYGNSISNASTQITGTSLYQSYAIISNCCTNTATLISYPLYFWVAVFRNDFSTRYCICFIEFEITTPSSGTINNNSTFSSNGLMQRYTKKRFLLPNNNSTTPSFTEVSSISINPGWTIGVELLRGINNTGITNITIGTQNSSNVTSNITYNTSINYDKYISGFFKNFSIIIQTI